LFSSRRRHTSSKRDWSSDVCSSDLEDVTGREITQTLLDAALLRENLILREDIVMLDFTSDDTACGRVVAAGPGGEPYTVGAGAEIGRASCRARVWRW